MLKNKQTVNISAAYPQLSRKECDEAEYHLGRYLSVVKRIFERVKREDPTLLTDLRMRANVRKEDHKTLSNEHADASSALPAPPDN